MSSLFQQVKDDVSHISKLVKQQQASLEGTSFDMSAAIQAQAIAVKNRILERSSCSCKRVVRSEAAPAACGFEHGEFARAILCVIRDPSFSVRHWERHVNNINHRRTCGLYI